MPGTTTNQNYYKDKPIAELPDYLPRIVVKFHEGVVKAYEDDAEKIFGDDSIPAWYELEKNYPGITLRRLYTSLSPEEIQTLVQRAKKTTPDYRPPNFLTYFAITVPKDSDPTVLLKDLYIRKEVEEAYIEGKPAPPPLGTATAPFAALQGYLTAEPLGIDAEFAKGIPGGEGAGTRFVDIEQGWTLDHEALLAANITQLVGDNQLYHGHGTAVLGQILATPNRQGVVGIAPQASGRVASTWRLGGTTMDIPDTIMVAAHALDLGDVLVLEVQVMQSSSGLWLPCEIESAIFDNIQLATAAGIIVVEAAGNGHFFTGGVDIATVSDSTGKLVFDLHKNPDRDSGAIIVAAAKADDSHQRLSFSNFGARIDCHAWGEKVASTGDGWDGNGITDYTEDFEGTSSATPIIAGAALVMQGIARARIPKLDIPARQARDFLRDPANGFPATPSNPAEPIGVMPDLKRISDVVLAL